MKADTNELKVLVNKMRSMSLELLNVANTVEELGDFKYINKMAKQSPTIIATLQTAIIEVIQERFDKALSLARDFVGEEVEPISKAGEEEVVSSPTSAESTPVPF